jgi:DNA-binding transcriptional regulator YiaG
VAARVAKARDPSGHASRRTATAAASAAIREVLMAKQTFHAPTHLMFLGRNALGVSREEFARLIGTSVRTMERWSAKRSTPAPHHLEALARHVHARDPALAAEIAAAASHTLASLGIAAPIRAPVPGPLVDSVVYAAAEMMDVSPRAIRPAISAAFARAKELGLDVAAIDGVLGPSAPTSRAKVKPPAG